LQAIILFLNIFVVFIPFIQFFVLRRPPFGDLPLWERIVESCVGTFDFKSPFGRRASQISGVHGLGSRFSAVTKLDISLISENHIQAAGKQERGRPTPMFRQMSLKSGGRRESMISNSRRVSAAGLDDISRLRTRKLTDAGKCQPEPSRKNMRALEDNRKPEEPTVTVERPHAAQPASEHSHANGHDGLKQHVTAASFTSQSNCMDDPDASNISHNVKLDGEMTYYVPFEPFQLQADLGLDSSWWRADDDSAYGVFPRPVIGTADSKPAAAPIP
jgi:hypothetical protein